MIDIHCHLLWGIDDGPKTLDESVQVCSMLKSRGVNRVIATPHYIVGSTYQTNAASVTHITQQLNEVLLQKVPEFEIMPGMEVFITPDIIDLIKSNEILTLNGTRYILIETSLNNISTYMEDIFYKLQLEGYIPIFAHPERNRKINMDFKLIERLISNGVLIQVNYDSLMGRYGKDVKKFTEILLKKGLVHFIATDTHCVSERFKGTGELSKILLELIGNENTEKIININPSRILENREVEKIIPAIEKKFFLKKLLKL
ncbi:tyrosine-protein phosphatase [Pseudobacteroides cellulosolvens]|uniref:protein-tyrosine-phosphatase n=1 Tax=Pseudobacteroides cellulosolvens ATCC 35603 = DSM 2933 TaxID=398512 RepID=A0A0L6JLH1_9FIRM|nr:CpsB/CapC family capsule biosynthesis tyrosine phosphatase [Pseudobacteroides cellulosolvens]KNY26605.1 Protein-tyrosine-phosphatase [Pseudobacteroides cellulosolvens ATCC 35603 = DSM 2933]